MVLGMLDEYKLEVGIAVAVFTIVFVGKVLFGGSENNKRKKGDQDDENANKKNI